MPAYRIRAWLERVKRPEIVCKPHSESRDAPDPTPAAGRVGLVPTGSNK